MKSRESGRQSSLSFARENCCPSQGKELPSSCDQRAKRCGMPFSRLWPCSVGPCLSPLSFQQFTRDSFGHLPDQPARKETTETCVLPDRQHQSRPLLPKCIDVESHQLR